MGTNFGTITLIGSGELTDSMTKIHRRLLARIGDDPNVVFLDTPAGFELNVDEISARAIEYFKQRLAVDLQVASFKSRNANEIQIASALASLHRADYIFAGPGSPSYAISNWHNTSVWKMVLQRWQSGAHFVFASAAAVATSYAALPVYEIFKAGHEVCWIDGLDALKPFGLCLAVVPHWNNAEGQTFDTRYCFMGKPRLEILERQLAPDAVILGIDEHTAITFDSHTQTCNVGGVGQVTVRYAGKEKYFPSGTNFPFDQLRANDLERFQGAESLSAPTAGPSLEIQMTTQYLEQLARAMQASGSEPQVQRELIDRAHDTMHELAEGWRAADNLLPDQTTAALVDLLVTTRTRLRAVKQFALADELRNDLTKLGIVLQDTATGTTWKKMPED
ncbi:MAG: Type 1 glutamine amidotransferase-like domain-containing protein [Anaerolineales bacterium]|nr:Type 1 glutamine amidotransferase-like domain-containing protein [Anaerolineales bacterium]